MSDPYVETPPMSRLETIGWLVMSAVMLYIMGLMVAMMAVVAVAQAAVRAVRRATC